MEFPGQQLNKTSLDEGLLKRNVQISRLLSNDMDYQCFKCLPIDYQTIDLEKVDNLHVPRTKKLKTSVVGGYYPKNFVHEPIQIVSSPGDRTIGLVVWPSSVGLKDIAILGTPPNQLTNNVIVEIGRLETEVIRQFKKKPRPVGSHT